MNTITVDKARLIETITKNREEHRETFLAAQAKFREKVIELLDQRLQDARAGKQVDQSTRLPEPVDYTTSYDTALAMLEWEKADEVELERDDFERYVENKWEWQRLFAANTQSYLG